jgi:hypothetical protein
LRIRSLTGLAFRNMAGDKLRSWLLGLCAFAIAAFALSTALVVHGA